jgi:hypothetical protein
MGVNVASLIQEEFQKLPKDVHPRMVMLDPEYWERFCWEIATDADYMESEIKREWQKKCCEYHAHGMTISDIKSIWCPEMEICFFRNPFIQKIRITYT